MSPDNAGVARELGIPSRLVRNGKMLNEAGISLDKLSVRLRSVLMQSKDPSPGDLSPKPNPVNPTVTDILDDHKDSIVGLITRIEKLLNNLEV